MATHSNILAGKYRPLGRLAGLQSMGHKELDDTEQLSTQEHNASSQIQLLLIPLIASFVIPEVSKELTLFSLIISTHTYSRHSVNDSEGPSSLFKNLFTYLGLCWVFVAAWAFP